MVIYLYQKCSTCQSALRFLELQSAVFTTKEIDKTPPSISELRKMLAWQCGNLKKLINTSGLLYREMHLAERLLDMSIEEVFQLFSQEGMLVKRPFLLADHFGLVGFKEAEWIQKF
jgi:arsenate reductase